MSNNKVSWDDLEPGTMKVSTDKLFNKLRAMTERLEEMEFMLEGKGPNSVLSQDYIDVLREHIQLALQGVPFGKEGEYRETNKS